LPICRATPGLVGQTTRRNGPDRLDPAASHADIPIVNIACWIAMAGDKLELVIHLEHAVRIGDHAMLVRAFDIFDIVTAKDRRQAAIDTLRLQTGIADSLVGFCMAHDRCQNKECILPLALVDAIAILVENSAIVGIHERVGAALQFVVDARIALEIVTSRSASTDDIAIHALCFQSVHSLFDHGDRNIDFGLSVLIGIHVLHGALIGLNARKFEPRGCGDCSGDFQNRFRRRDAAASGTAVDLDKTFDRRAVLLGCSGEIRNIVDVVDADDGTGSECRDTCQAVNLGGVADLVRDKHILYAAANEGLSLADFLTADTA